MSIVTPKNLLPGMVLAADVRDRNGRLLLKTGRPAMATVSPLQPDFLKRLVNRTEVEPQLAETLAILGERGT